MTLIAVLTPNFICCTVPRVKDGSCVVVIKPVIVEMDNLKKNEAKV